MIRPSAVATMGWYSVRSSAPAQGAAQVTVERGPIVGQPLLADVDRAVAGTAFALGLVHGRVSVLEDLFGNVVAPARRRRCRRWR